MGRLKRERLKKMNAAQDKIDRLFLEAFLKSEQHYNSVTLCGWKPIDKVYQNKDRSMNGWEYVDRHDLRMESIADDLETVVKVYETSMETVIEVDLPELIKETIRIDVRGQVLMLSGHQYSTSENATGEFSFRDDSFKSFQKYITLPESVKPGQVTAKFKTGGIKILIKKKILL